MLAASARKLGSCAYDAASAGGVSIVAALSGCWICGRGRCGSASVYSRLVNRGAVLNSSSSCTPFMIGAVQRCGRDLTRSHHQIFGNRACKAKVAVVNATQRACLDPNLQLWTGSLVISAAPQVCLMSCASSQLYYVRLGHTALQARKVPNRQSDCCCA